MKNELRNIRWLVPKESPLTTSEECINLLNKGYVLVNNEGYKVYKDYYTGLQIRSNPRRKRNYKFSNPNLWQVLDDVSTQKKGYSHIVNTKTLWFKITDTLNVIITWLDRKLLM